MSHETPTLDHAALVRPFLSSRYRSRYDSLAPGSRRRAELFNKLCHQYEDVLNWQFARPINGSSLPDQLRDAGTQRTCYCFCGPEEFDGKEMPLSEVCMKLIGSGLPVLLVCEPGVLAYFEPEYEQGSTRQYTLQLNSARNLQIR